MIILAACLNAGQNNKERYSVRYVNRKVHRQPIRRVNRRQKDCFAKLLSFLFRLSTTCSRLPAFPLSCAYECRSFRTAKIQRSCAPLVGSDIRVSPIA
jgi:hypothetical protein